VIHFIFTRALKKNFDVLCIALLCFWFFVQGNLQFFNLPTQISKMVIGNNV